ncbi:hypothetical protein IMZ48_08540 [Candidatus Bathyarchaeota archaeon]|nr:hypothetical protein [Candidatus Bathyarchaeota archaeon]
MSAPAIQPQNQNGGSCGTWWPNSTSSATFFDEDETAVERFPNPVVQILTLKRITAKQEGGSDRFRIAVSDGQMFCQGMVATQSHHLITEQQLDVYKIARIKQYQKNCLNNKRFAPLPRPRAPLYIQVTDLPTLCTGLSSC